nr:hypothetical protein [uncultured Prevotella sp.]
MSKNPLKKSSGAIAISLQFSCKLVNLSLQIGNLTVRLFLLLLLLITQGNIGIQICSPLQYRSALVATRMRNIQNCDSSSYATFIGLKYSTTQQEYKRVKKIS